MSDWIDLPEAEFRMGNGRGDGYPDDGELPVRSVTVGPLSIAATAVTNAEFAAFVESTGWQTDAERYGWSFVFGGLLPDEFPDTRGVAAAPWWRQVYEADWRRPEGPHSSVDDRPDHRDGQGTQAPDLCHRFLAAVQSCAEVLQEISDGPEDADPFAGLNDEEFALARAAYSRIKKIVGELRLAT